MSTMNSIYNDAVLFLSLIAILVTVMSVQRQAANVRQSNFMLFTNQMGRVRRSSEFRDAEDYIVNELHNYNPRNGIRGLPSPARDHALLVGDFYQDVGTLVVRGTLEKNLMIAIFYTHIKEAWRALEPFVLVERDLLQSSCGGHLYGSFEGLARDIDKISIDKVRERYLRHAFDDWPRRTVTALP